MAYLDGQGLARLRDAITGGDKIQRGFIGPDEFAIFINDSFEINFANISRGESFKEQVYNFLDELNVKGKIDEALYFLADYWDREDLLELVRSLLDAMEDAECARSYFVSYAGLEKESKTGLARAGAFRSLDGWACLPSGDRKIIKLTETIKGEIDRSDLFVALVGRYYVRSDKLQGEIFDYALDNWRASLNAPDGHRSNRRFAVLFLDQAGRKWWEDRYAASVPQSDSLLIQDIGADLAMSAPSIRDWLAGASRIQPGPDEAQHEPEGTPPGPEGASLEPEEAQPEPEGTQPRQNMPTPVILLGEPFGTSPDEAQHALTALHDILGQQVTRWPDNWYTKTLLAPDTTQQMLQQKIIFVRAITNSAASVGEARNALKPFLLNTFGFRIGDEEEWRQRLGTFTRIYWRPSGPKWNMEGAEPAELGWTGEAQSVGIRLAQIANLAGVHESARVVRYEDPKADDAEQTQRNRKILADSLECAARAGKDGAATNTVRISFSNLEDSVRRFVPGGLNVIALHDLEARPRDRDDTLLRFAGADARIDSVIRSHFPPGFEDEIIRVAVLLKNPSEFDGLTFSQETAVYRWNLLKCPTDQAGNVAPDAADLNNLMTEASFRLQKMGITV